MYTVGAVVGMVPFMFIFTYIPMYWTIPAMDVLWGLFTLLQYRAHSFGEMAAYRFLVGFFEVRLALIEFGPWRLTNSCSQAAFFPAMHYVFGKPYHQTIDWIVRILTDLLGSWYRGHEIARRGGIFYTGLNLGTLTAGLIAAGASHRLEGAQGMSGWRWM